MADFELKSDEEKAEELKQWWKANGMSVAVGIALAIGGMFGWQQWQEHKKTQAEGGSRLFSQLSGENADSSKILQQIQADYAGTPYSTLAALSAAKDCVSKQATNENDKNVCVSMLRQASNSAQPEVKDVAKLRLARTLIFSEQYDEAEKVISATFPTAYASLVNEIKGDIHFAKKEFDKAREAYDRAILSAADQNVEFLKMKRDDLGKTDSTASNSSDKKSGA